MVAGLGPGLSQIILVLGLTGWERYARVVRAEVLALRGRGLRPRHTRPAPSLGMR